MQLVMYIGNDLIASTAIIKQNISQPGYVSGLKRRMMKEHSEILEFTTNEPEFLLINVSNPFPKMNHQVSTLPTNKQ